MMDQELLTTQLAELDRRLALLENYRHLPAEDLEEAAERTAAIERHAQIAIQSAIDAAGVITTGLRLREPRTYAESFEVLAEDHLLDWPLARRLSNLARFRNVLVHGYLIIDPDETVKFLKEGLDDLARFVAAALAASRKKPRAPQRRHHR